jgi:SAM-dependent methyltransferase
MTEMKEKYVVQEEGQEEGPKREKQVKDKKAAVSPYEGCYVKWRGDRTFFLVENGCRHKIRFEFIAIPHIARYAWACSKVYGRWVVDLGCGAGYGTHMLSWVARYAFGVDRCAETVRHACVTYQAQSGNLQYQTMDLDHLSEYEYSQLGHMGDIYVAMEVLEHLENPMGVIGRLTPLVWSMPIGDGSKFHVRPYSIEEVCKMLPGPKWMQNEEGMVVRFEAGASPGYLLGVTGQ